MGDILTEIDATVEGLCACGCGTKLGERSRSGWWATETCQVRWQGRLAQDGSNSAAAAEGRPPLNLDVFRIRTDECWWVYNLTAPGVLEALQRWLSANHLDPAEVRQASERHVIEDGWLRVECFVADSAGSFLLDDAGEVRTVLRSVPLVERLPDRMEASTNPTIRLGLDGSRWTEGVEQAGAALRRVVEAIGSTVGAYAGLPATLRRTIEAHMQAERDRMSLRAVCTDQAMYESALAEAEVRGWPVQSIYQAVALGRYTADGWSPSPPFSSGDTEPSGLWSTPDYAQLPEVEWHLWCSMDDQTRAEALRCARRAAMAMAIRQETALAQVLAICEPTERRVS